MDTLGKRIKLARGAMSQELFSRLLEISKGALGFYERDKNLPNTDVVLKICSITGVRLEWLLIGCDPMRKGEAPNPAPVCPSAAESSGCPRCAKLEKKLEKLELKLEKTELLRDELIAESRTLWKENAKLRESLAGLREKSAVLAHAGAAAE